MSIEQRIELTVADSESLHHELTRVGLKLFSAYLLAGCQARVVLHFLS